MVRYSGEAHGSPTAGLGLVRGDVVATGNCSTGGWLGKAPGRASDLAPPGVTAGPKAMKATRASATRGQMIESATAPELACWPDGQAGPDIPRRTISALKGIAGAGNNRRHRSHGPLLASCWHRDLNPVQPARMIPGQEPPAGSRPDAAPLRPTAAPCDARRAWRLVWSTGAVVAGLHSGTSMAGLSAQASARQGVDLILVIDRSKSMDTGQRRIFPAVKEAATRLIERTAPGDNVVLVSYAEGVEMNPAVVVYGDRDRAALSSLVRRMRATGRYTFTVAALDAALREASRLDSAQRALGAGVHRKLVVLMTDGLNDPPPGAGRAELSMDSIGRRYDGMPWFVWQIQLGKSLDPAVDTLKRYLPRYRAVQSMDADSLLGAVRDEISRSLSALALSVSARVEPRSLDFGSVPVGGEASAPVSVAVNLEGDGTVVLRFVSEGDPNGMISLEPDSFAFARTGTDTLHVRFAPRHGQEGTVSGILRLSASVPTVPAQSVTWQAEVTRGASGRRPRAALLGGIVLAAAAGSAFLVLRRRGQRLFGTLIVRGTGTEASHDLGTLRTGTVRLGHDRSAGHLVALARPAVVDLVVEEHGGTAFVVAYAQEGLLLHRGRQVRRLQLFDRDEFQVGAVSVEYRGDVPARRPGT